MKLDFVARGYVLNNDNKILLVKHNADSQRVLPGGHVEKDETLVAAFEREMREEFDVGIEVIGVVNETSDPQVIPESLPISIHQVQYYSHDQDAEVRKLEFRYFARIHDGELTPNSEISSYDWFGIDEILRMHAPTDVFQSLQDVLKQNEDLLELL